MKCNIAIAFLSLLMFSSCMHKGGVEYNKVASINMGKLNKENAKFGAIILFNNISEDAFVIKDLVLDLKIDGKDIGTILVKKPKDVRPHSEFSVSVDYMYESSRIVDEGDEPADVYLIELGGDLTLKDKNGEEVLVPVHYKASYAYKTEREERVDKRKERKERKKEKETDN